MSGASGNRAEPRYRDNTEAQRAHCIASITCYFYSTKYILILEAEKLLPNQAIYILAQTKRESGKAR